jgi:hypothetical protein
MQQVVLRQRHQTLLLMHNPLHQQLQQQEQLRSQQCNSNRCFQITGYSASNNYAFTPSGKYSGTGFSNG